MPGPGLNDTTFGRNYDGPDDTAGRHPGHSLTWPAGSGMVLAVFGGLCGLGVAVMAHLLGAGLLLSLLVYLLAVPGFGLLAGGLVLRRRAANDLPSAAPVAPRRAPAHR